MFKRGGALAEVGVRLASARRSLVAAGQTVSAGQKRGREGKGEEEKGRERGERKGNPLPGALRTRRNLDPHPALLASVAGEKILKIIEDV